MTCGRLFSGFGILVLGVIASVGLLLEIGGGITGVHGAAATILLGIVLLPTLLGLVACVAFLWPKAGRTGNSARPDEDHPNQP